MSAIAPRPPVDSVGLMQYVLDAWENIVFYGPYACPDCGRQIVKAALQSGGQEFDAPDGPIYPNTRWRRHDHGPGQA
jgi:hypothetical protein